MELKLGQKAFLKPINNAARYGNKEIKEVEIVKIGRKYFFVGKEGETNERLMTKFNIEDRKQTSNYSPDWQFYFSKQEILDEEEEKELTSKIKRKFDTWEKTGLSLDQLKRIHSIINE